MQIIPFKMNIPDSAHIEGNVKSLNSSKRRTSVSLPVPSPAPSEEVNLETIAKEWFLKCHIFQIVIVVSVGS